MAELFEHFANFLGELLSVCTSYCAVLPALRLKASFRAGLKPITVSSRNSAIAAEKTIKTFLSVMFQEFTITKTITITKTVS